MATTTHEYPANQYSAMEFLKNEKFCAAVTLSIANLTEGSTAAAAASIGDVIQWVPVVKGLLVTDVALRVDTSAAAAFGLDIGDGSDPNGYDNAVAIKATNGTITKSLEATDAYGVGRLYTSADTIDASVLTSSCSAASITLIVEGVVIPQYA